MLADNDVTVGFVLVLVLAACNFIDYYSIVHTSVCIMMMVAAAAGGGGCGSVWVCSDTPPVTLIW